MLVSRIIITLGGCGYLLDVILFTIQLHVFLACPQAVKAHAVHEGGRYARGTAHPVCLIRPIRYLGGLVDIGEWLAVSFFDI